MPNKKMKTNQDGGSVTAKDPGAAAKELKKNEDSAAKMGYNQKFGAARISPSKMGDAKAGELMQGAAKYYDGAGQYMNGAPKYEGAAKHHGPMKEHGPMKGHEGPMDMHKGPMKEHGPMKDKDGPMNSKDNDPYSRAAASDRFFADLKKEKYSRKNPRHAGSNFFPPENPRAKKDLVKGKTTDQDLASVFYDVDQDGDSVFRDYNQDGTMLGRGIQSLIKRFKG